MLRAAASAGAVAGGQRLCQSDGLAEAENGLARRPRAPRAAQRTPSTPVHMAVVCARGACAHSANAAPQGGSQGRGWPPARAQATREPRARQGAAKPGVIADRPCDLACAARAEVVQGLRGHLRPPAHASRSAATPARQRGQPGAEIVGNGGIELTPTMLLAACRTWARRKALEALRPAMRAMPLSLHVT